MTARRVLVVIVFAEDAARVGKLDHFQELGGTCNLSPGLALDGYLPGCRISAEIDFSLAEKITSRLTVHFDRASLECEVSPAPRFNLIDLIEQEDRSSRKNAALRLDRRVVFIAE